MLMSCCQSAKSSLFFPSVHNFSSSYLGTSSWCLSFAASRPESVPPFCFRFFIRDYSSLLFYLPFILFSFCFANCNTPIMCSPSSPHNESYIWRQCSFCYSCHLRRKVFRTQLHGPTRFSFCFEEYKQTN
jgi:hypothetical protein